MSGMMLTAALAALLAGATGILLVILIGFWRELRTPCHAVAQRRLHRGPPYVYVPATNTRDFKGRH